MQLIIKLKEGQAYSREGLGPVPKQFFSLWVSSWSTLWNVTNSFPFCRYGANAIALSKVTPFLVKLLADQNVHVREQAFNTLTEMYRHIGDKLRVDIQRKYASSINPSRWEVKVFTAIVFFSPKNGSWFLSQKISALGKQRIWIFEVKLCKTEIK